MAGSGAPRRAAARRRPAGRRAGPARGFWAAPALLLCVLLASACAPQQQGLGPERGAPRLQDDSFFARDGAQLPVRIWPAGGETRAAVVALHGLNVYSRIFDDAAPWWAEQGIAVYAYDQRGFGGGPRPGIWGGAEAFVADARDMLQLVGARHPGAPVFLLGESMGAAVTLLTLAELAAGGTADAVPPAGAVLVAPAVWGGEAMNPAFRGGLWFAAHTMPWNRATGDGLQRRASDNIELLRELGRDPLVIKHTRVDVVYQATQLMGSAYAAAGRLDDVPVLVLYGARDEIVPPQPVQGLAAGLSAPYRLVLYPDGWHMLLRDLQAQVVWRDVAAWIADPAAPLPSAHEIALADWADVED